MKVALIRPLCEDETEFAEPLGLEALAGYLLRENIACKIFDRILMKLENQDFYGAIDQYDPSLIAISITGAEELGDALRLIQLLKQPGRQFAAGGLWVTTARAAASAALPGFVTQICGEGELALAGLAKNLIQPEAKKTSPDHWAVAYRPNLQTYLKYNKSINIRTARGCPGKCLFCSTPALPNHLGRYAARSIKLVVDEIGSLASRCAQLGQWPVFCFVDDDFGSLDRIEELTRSLKERRLKVAFFLELRAATLTGRPFDREQWQAWRDAGLCRVFVGLESFNVSTLEQWNKPVVPHLLVEVIREIRKIKIEVEIGYILWHRGSTRQQIFEEIDLLHENGLLTPKAALSRLIIYPGSDLYSRYGYAGEAVQEPLTPEMEGLYQDMRDRLQPLYDLWIKGALWLPQCAAVAFLSGDETHLQQLKAILETIKEKTQHRIQNTPTDISPFFHTTKEELNSLYQDWLNRTGIDCC